MVHGCFGVSLRLHGIVSAVATPARTDFNARGAGIGSEFIFKRYYFDAVLERDLK